MILDFKTLKLLFRSYRGWYLSFIGIGVFFAIRNIIVGGDAIVGLLFPLIPTLVMLTILTFLLRQRAQKKYFKEFVKDDGWREINPRKTPKPLKDWGSFGESVTAEAKRESKPQMQIGMLEYYEGGSSGGKGFSMSWYLTWQVFAAIPLREPAPNKAVSRKIDRSRYEAAWGDGELFLLTDSSLQTPGDIKRLVKFASTL